MTSTTRFLILARRHGLALLGVLCLFTGSARPAAAACRFEPQEFFPDRNDRVEIPVHASPGAICVMRFREGPGYRFTSAQFATAPLVGVLALTGPTQFTYYVPRDYKGPDSYAVKMCAVVHGRKGCSVLRYNVISE